VAALSLVDFRVPFWPAERIEQVSYAFSLAAEWLERKKPEE
jgi:hypothetical protein